MKNKSCSGVWFVVFIALLTPLVAICDPLLTSPMCDWSYPDFPEYVAFCAPHEPESEVGYGLNVDDAVRTKIDEFFADADSLGTDIYSSGDIRVMNGATQVVTNSKTIGSVLCSNTDGRTYTDGPVDYWDELMEDFVVCLKSSAGSYFKYQHKSGSAGAVEIQYQRSPNDICPDGADEEDSDEDGTPDCIDACPNDAANDADQDGVCGDADICPDGVDICASESSGDHNCDGIVNLLDIATIFTTTWLTSVEGSDQCAYDCQASYDAGVASVDITSDNQVSYDAGYAKACTDISPTYAGKSVSQWELMSAASVRDYVNSLSDWSGIDDMVASPCWPYNFNAFERGCLQGQRSDCQPSD